MADDRVTRIDADLLDAAATQGRREQRSARQQLEHWARVGRELCAHNLSALAAEDRRLAANTRANVAIRERAAAASFGRALLEAGQPVVALDDQGDLVEFQPDGRTKPRR